MPLGIDHAVRLCGALLPLPVRPFAQWRLSVECRDFTQPIDPRPQRRVPVMSVMEVGHFLITPALAASRSRIWS
jgi:hypothetical protein